MDLVSFYLWSSVFGVLHAVLEDTRAPRWLYVDTLVIVYLEDYGLFHLEFFQSIL